MQDLWLEPAPQNAPGTWEERPNWKRKTRYSLEQVREFGALGETPAAIDKVIHVPIGTTQQMKMSCATFKATTENPPMAPFAKGGGPKDRGIFASKSAFS
ncbi:MAG TPA: hypothetical protein VFQ89_09945 [Candidatus Binatia bacterium]|nr:hypothetical protein [Candidatus Binatia bacterium]